MIHSDLFEGWRLLLPPCIKISAGPLLDHAGALTVAERLSVGDVDPERLRELEAGRLYAKRALSMLGIDGVDLPVGPNRAPVWPGGIVGSLTHARDTSSSHIAAAVGRACDVGAIGIDVEFDRGLPPEVWPIVLTENERNNLTNFPVTSRASEVLTLWCIKEAATKALQFAINPAEIETDYDHGRQEFRLTWNDPRSNQSQPARVLRGRAKRCCGFVLAAAIF